MNYGNSLQFYATGLILNLGKERRNLLPLFMFFKLAILNSLNSAISDDANQSCDDLLELRCIYTVESYAYSTEYKPKGEANFIFR